MSTVPDTPATLAPILFFRGSDRFLSNFFHHGPGVTVEHLFQSRKMQNPADSAVIMATPSATEAKRLGRKLTMRADWEGTKDAVMYQALVEKFSDPELRAKLLATGAAHLEGGNTWCDLYWGVCHCPQHQVFVPATATSTAFTHGTGVNHLGALLMQLRRELAAA